MRRLSTVRAFTQATKGVAALEFAMIFPVLLILMLSGQQLVTYVNAARKVELVTASISQTLSQFAPTTTGSTTATVNTTDLHFSSDAALVIFPYLMKDAARQGIAWNQDISINFASIQFTQISSGCTGQADQSTCYVANVVWTTSGASGNNYRPCVVPQLPANDTAAPSRASLPRSIFGPGSVIAVDVVYQFRPVFGTNFIPAIRIARSVYVQPRYASLITFDSTNNDGIATSCALP